MLRHVALVRTDVSEKRIASIIRVIRIVEIGTTLAVTSNRSRLRRNIILVTRKDGDHTLLQIVGSYKSHTA
jgi:hypothetical protein